MPAAYPPRPLASPSGKSTAYSKILMDKLTLDTNVLRDWAWCLGNSQEVRYSKDPDGKRRELSILFGALKALRDDGQCEIGVTTQLYIDYDGKRPDNLPEYIEDLIGPYVSVVVPVSFFGFPLQFPVIFHDEKEVQKLFLDTFPHSKPDHKKYSKNQRDTWQLYAHRLANRDIFLTQDKGILSRKPVLASHWNIHVESLDKYVKRFPDALEDPS